MPPDIPLRSQLEDMTEMVLKNLCRESNPQNITYINLFNNKIKKRFAHLCRLLNKAWEVIWVVGEGKSSSNRVVHVQHAVIARPGVGVVRDERFSVQVQIGQKRSVLFQSPEHGACTRASLH